MWKTRKHAWYYSRGLRKVWLFGGKNSEKFIKIKLDNRCKKSKFLWFYRRILRKKWVLWGGGGKNPEKRHVLKTRPTLWEGGGEVIIIYGIKINWIIGVKGRKHAWYSRGILRKNWLFGGKSVKKALKSHLIIGVKSRKKQLESDNIWDQNHALI